MAPLREFDLDPTTLSLEVAESALLDDIDTTSEALRALKDLGVHLAIDDFGTGGSSLTYLRRFPFDELKIDRMFVEGLGRSAADDAIVAATIDMAHALGMVVAAEGVETEVQRVRLCRARVRPRPGVPPRATRGTRPPSPRARAANARVKLRSFVRDRLRSRPASGNAPLRLLASDLP